MEDICKILVVEVSGIGDVVMSVPALRALRKKYPQSQITILLSARAASLLKNCPYINEIVTFNIDNFRLTTAALNIINTIQLLRRIINLRRKKFNVAINFYRIASLTGSLRMKVLFRVIAPSLSVGRNSEGRGEFFHIKLNETISTMEHEVKQKLKVVKLLDAVAEDERLELWPQQEDETFSLKLMQQFNINQDDFLVGINPEAYQKGNRWFEDRFTKLADILIDKYGAKVIFFGSQRFRKTTAKIVVNMKKTPINLAAKLTLNQYASLIKNIKLFITLDSGPMHIASVFKIPTIALFGGEQPLRFSPYLNNNAVILQKKVDCSPCTKKKKCIKRLCMRAITVDDVIAAVEKILNKR